MKIINLLPIITTILIPTNAINIEYTDDNVFFECHENDLTFQNNNPTYSTATSTFYDLKQKASASTPNNNFASIQLNSYSQYTLTYTTGQTHPYNQSISLTFAIQIVPFATLGSTTTSLKLNVNQGYIHQTNAISTDLYYSYSQQDVPNDLVNDINFTRYTPAQRMSELESYKDAGTQTRIQLHFYNEPTQFTLPNIQISAGNNTYIYGFFVFNMPEQPYNYNFDNPKAPFISDMYMTAQRQQGIPTTEIVPIADLMFEILAMPFSFISQAFDLTLFPNTNYAVNISQLFLGFIAIAMLLWLLKLILGKADIGQWIGNQQANTRETRQYRKQRRENQRADAAAKKTIQKNERDKKR